MSRFAAIKSAQGRRREPPSAPGVETAAMAQSKTAARAGKKVVSGHFSTEMSRALHLLAVEQSATLQALMGEAFDDLLRKYGKHPFGER